VDNKEVSIKFNNKVSGGQDLKTYEKRLRNIYSYITAIKKGQKLAFKDLEKDVISVEKSTEGVNQNLDKVAKKANVAFNFKGIKEAGRLVLNLGKNVQQLTKEYTSYIENMNLLKVAYSRQDTGLKDYNEQVEETSESVRKLIDQMSRVYGLDESRLTRQFGLFKQLSNAMKLPADTAEQLSEHLVKMSNDISSLYNIDLDRASNALQSAMAGQVRPIRSATGADITEKTLQQTVDALGLKRSISDLSYVEKRLIMVISLTEQLKKSQGDYARTIEGVAQQSRILGEQWDRVKRSVGEMAYPLVRIILPYVNAILMVVTKIADLLANVIAKFLKVPLEEPFDYGSMVGISDATQDIIDGMDEAGASTDKLKDKLRGLRGFDKLNVISDRKDDLGAGMGIDPKIMSAFSSAFANYDDKLEEIQMKATKIADAIWEWLKGTDGSYTNLKLIGSIVGVLATAKIITTVKNIKDFVKGLSGAKNVIGTTGGKGLLASLGGLHGVLVAIAGVLAVIVAMDIVKLIGQYKDMKKAFETSREIEEKNLKTVNELSDKYKKLSESTGVTDEQTRLNIETLKTQNKFVLDNIQKMEDQKGVISGLLGINKKNREEQEKMVNTLKSTTDKFRELYEQGKLNEEGIGDFTYALDEQITAMDILGQDTSDLKDEYEKLTGKKWQLTLNTVLEDGVTGKFYKIVDGIKKYLTNTFGGNGSFGSSSGGGARANGGVFAGGKWHDITQYAGGTTNAPVGQMFIARERGAELVGNLNGHTAVMNNDQIVASVSDGVYRAVKMAGGTSNQNQAPQIYNIYLDENHKIGTYTLEQLQGMAKTNGKPITITG